MTDETTAGNSMLVGFDPASGKGDHAVTVLAHVDAAGELQIDEVKETDLNAAIVDGDQGAAGQAQNIEPSATHDPFNAAIAATAGEVVDEPGAGPSVEQQAAAMTSYIEAGVEKAAAPSDGHDIMTRDAFRAGIRALLQHLHLDHPENYLPPK